MLAEAWNSVPIPLWVIPAKASDAEMSVYDAATDTLRNSSV